MMNIYSKYDLTLSLSVTTVLNFLENKSFISFSGNVSFMCCNMENINVYNGFQHFHQQFSSIIVRYNLFKHTVFSVFKQNLNRFEIYF